MPYWQLFIYLVILGIAVVAIYMAFSVKQEPIWLRIILIVIGLLICWWIAFKGGFLQNKHTPSERDKLIAPLLQ